MALPRPKKPQTRTTASKKVSSSLSKESLSLQKKTIASSTHWLSSRKSSGGSWLLFIVLLVVALLGWMYRDQLSSFIANPQIDTGKNISGANNLFVGKDIVVEWLVERATSTRYSYTHTLSSDELYGMIGLRSSSINLYELQDIVKLSWRIVEFSNNLYVLEVQQVVQDESETQSGILYFSTPGLLLQNIAKDGFTITQSTTTRTIAIDNSTTSAKINIRYFPCSNERTYNCTVFEESFKNATGAQSVDNYDNIFYKLNDENTWFANLDNRYGIYIETSNAQLFPFIIEKIQFITEDWTNQHLATTAKTMCKEEMIRLQEITTGTLSQTGSFFIWNITGTNTNAEIMNCLLQFDPEDLTNILLVSTTNNSSDPVVEPILPSTGTQSDDESDEPTTPSTLLPSSSATQFPLRPGKELLFSTRGMTVSFPSPNISFASTNITEWPNGLKCSAKTNIIEYSKRDQLSTNPSVSLYFCAWTLASPNANFRTLSSNDGTILIEVLDASWTNFANAITVN